MGEIVYTCGWCRRAVTGKVVHHTFRMIQKGQMGDSKVFVAAICPCGRMSEIEYRFWKDIDDKGEPAFHSDDEPEGVSYWWLRLDSCDGAPPVVHAKPASQYPALTRSPPSGVSDTTTSNAWSAAEKAIADPPIKGMAYRQVLESAVKALETKAGLKGSPTKPLGARVQSLIAKNALPNHLPELIDGARGLGNRAAHEFDDFNETDVAIIRELCEAVLRQCFSIPALVERTERLVEKRKAEAAAKAEVERSTAVDDAV